MLRPMPLPLGRVDGSTHATRRDPRAIDPVVSGVTSEAFIGHAADRGMKSARCLSFALWREVYPVPGLHASGEAEKSRSDFRDRAEIPRQGACYRHSLTACAICSASIPAALRSSSGVPEVGMVRTASFITTGVFAIAPANASRTASPSPPSCQ